MRAVGVVRVSKSREGESFKSPSEQRERIEDTCRRDGMELVAIHEEIAVSGGTPLARRDGLRAAVEAVEASEADVLMVAYFDRLVRSLRVQDEVVSRVEDAGGRVLALDFGEVTGKSAAQWLSGTMLGAVSEYYRRSVGERIGAAQARAIARGVPTFDHIPPGYRREAGTPFLIDPTAAPAVREAFRMRAEGATIKEARAFLFANGVERSYHGVQSMLASRIYLGELRFGKLFNPEAHEPLIDPKLWEAVQRVRETRGTRPRSKRLLARLGVLRCGTCGARMSVGTAHFGRYPFYRCPPVGDCPKRMHISATIAEAVVTDAVKEAIADMEGRASVARDAQEAEALAERAQGELDAAIAAFQGLEAEPAAVEKLRGLREARDSAREGAHRLSRLRSAVTVTGADWDALTLDERRALIRAVVARAVVGPGRGASRIRCELVGEDPAGSS